MRKYLTMDIGGTFIKYSIMDTNYNEEYIKSVPTKEDPEEFRKQLLSIVNEVKETIHGIAISIGGFINPITCENTDFSVGKNFTSFNLKEVLSDHIGLPVSVENDSNCAALTEMKLGAGKECSHICVITIGTGIGGAIIQDRKLFKGLRTIPVILDICKDMDELCKDAWLINFTNPVGMVMEAISRYTNRKKAVGLCNLPIGMHKDIAKILKRPMEEVHVTFSGLNHLVFVTGVYVDGKDVLEQVMDSWGVQSGKNVTGLEWDRGFIKALGAIPCYYHRYYYMAKEYLNEGIEYYMQNGTRAEKVKKIEDELLDLYQDTNLADKPKQLEQRGGAYYSDAACNLICSIYNDTRDIQVVNTVNNGAIPELEYDEIGELGCIITKEGPIPIANGKLPKATHGLIQEIKSFEIAACEAAVSGDYDKALLAMMINPLVGSQDLAIKVLDEMLEAHKEYLPGFKHVIED